MPERYGMAETYGRELDSNYTIYHTSKSIHFIESHTRTQTEQCDPLVLVFLTFSIHLLLLLLFQFFFSFFHCISRLFVTHMKIARIRLPRITSHAAEEK